METIQSPSVTSTDQDLLRSVLADLSKQIAENLSNATTSLDKVNSQLKYLETAVVGLKAQNSLILKIQERMGLTPQ